MNIELSLSCQILCRKQVLQFVMTSMINSSRSFIVRQQRCGCQDHGLAYQKLKMVTSCSNQREGIYGIKIWAADDVITPSVLDVGNFNVVVNEGDVDVDVGASKNSVVVRDIGEIQQILGLSLFQLQKRCKVQYLMRISHRKYQDDHAKCIIKEISLKLMEKRRKSSMLQLLSFMRYHHQKRQNFIKKYFTIWVIGYYEGNLSVLNQKVVKQKYFTSQTDRSLLSSCFVSWRKMLQS